MDWRRSFKTPEEEAALADFSRRFGSTNARVDVKPSAGPGKPAPVPPPAPMSLAVATQAPTQQAAPQQAAAAAALAASSCQNECAICMDAEPSAVGIPCGHRVLCVACAVVYLKSHTECPACARQLEGLFVPGRGVMKPNKWTQPKAPNIWAQRRVA